MQKQFLLVAALFAVTTTAHLEAKPDKDKSCCTKTRNCCNAMKDCRNKMDDCLDDGCCKDCTDKRCKSADEMKDCCGKMKRNARHHKKPMNQSRHKDRPVTDEENTLNPGSPDGRGHYAEKDGAETFNGRHKPKSERDAERKRRDEK